MAQEKTTKHFLRVMKALSDPSRVKIVKALGKKDLCVCELTALLGLAQPTVSKHLRILEDAGLVTSWRDGTWVNYRLAAGDETPYARAMLDLLHGWLDDDPEIAAVVTKVDETDRRQLYRGLR